MNKKKKAGGIEVYGYYCAICREPLTQKKGGQRRRTCSDACRQALYRERKGRYGMRSKRRGKIIEKRRSMPLTERRFDPVAKPVLELGQYRWLFECQLCSKPYLVERIDSRRQVSAYCSAACAMRAKTIWRNFTKGRYKALADGGVDPRVEERLALGKVSPLCPHCGKPFAPNTTPEGDKLRGRPRKYCSNICRFQAYERRWKLRTKRARVHRFHECVECGKKFDRTDRIGRRTKRFCSRTCSHRFIARADRARWKVMWEYTRKNKWLKAWKPGAGGFGTAERNSTKNRAKRAAKQDADAGSQVADSDAQQGG